MNYAFGDCIALIIMVLAPVISIGVLSGWLRLHHWRLPKNPKWPQLFFFNAFLMMTGVSTIVLIGELCYRYVYDATEAYGVCRTTQAWFNRHWLKNDIGFRDPGHEYLADKTPDKPRVLIIGDSFTAGHGVNDSQDCLGQHLRRLLPNFEFFILAACGHDTSQEIQLLNHLLRSQCEADAVLLIYCLNDIGELMEDNPIVKIVYHHKHQLNPAFRHSYFLNTMYCRYQTLMDPRLQIYYGFLQGAFTDHHWQDHRRLLERFQKVAQNRYPKLMVATFPFLHNLDDHYPFAAAHRVLNEHWDSHQVPHFDLLPIYKGRPERELVVNARDAHPNAKAHQLAAEALAPFIRKVIEEPKTDP